MKEELPVSTKSFRELLEKELSKRGRGGGGHRDDDDNNGKPDRPDGPSIVSALIMGALAAILLAIVSKSKPKE